jgi:hypothetical protein
VPGDDNDEDDDQPDEPDEPDEIPSGPAHPPGGAVWEGGWWKDPTGSVQIDIPKGFSVGGGVAGYGGAAIFAGNCGGAPCTIYAISSPTYGVEMSDAMIGQMVSQMQSQMAMTGQSGGVSTIRVQGRDHYSLVMENPADGTRGQLVVFLGRKVFAMVLVQSPRASFDQTADFRQSFYEKRVRVK